MALRAGGSIQLTEAILEQYAQERAEFLDHRPLEHDSIYGDLLNVGQSPVFPTGNKSGPKMSLLLYLPNRMPRPVLAFLGLNFYGNYCVHSDPGIELSQSWMRPSKEVGIVNHRATEASRGSQASNWQVEMVITRGYASATVYYGDIEPDFPLGWKMGLRAALGKHGTNTVFKPDDWGAIGVWAWGLSRAMDYLEREAAVDSKRLVGTKGKM